jgi:hypothetical protein
LSGRKKHWILPSVLPSGVVFWAIRMGSDM